MLPLRSKYLRSTTTSTLLTSDGRWIAWPHSDARVTCLSADRVLALLSPVALERVLAHEQLTTSQLSLLFGGTPNKLRRARYLRRCARRIRTSKLERLCEGLRENVLVAVFRRSEDPLELTRLLLAESEADPSRFVPPNLTNTTTGGR